jgi:cytidine deaminase
MDSGNIHISYKKYNSIDELPAAEQQLVKDAKALAKTAYAPYSGFRVASVALMSDGSIVRGTNQENASYPIGLCAERVMLAAASSVAPGQSIETIAITYESDTVDISAPVAPCGICRQSLLEFESRFKQPMRVLLAGNKEVFVFESVSLLLPLGFKPHHLGK